MRAVEARQATAVVQGRRIGYLHAVRKTDAAQRLAAAADGHEGLVGHLAMWHGGGRVRVQIIIRLARKEPK